MNRIMSLVVSHVRELTNSNGTAVEIIEGDELVYRADTENDARVDLVAYREMGIRSILVVPLKHSETAVGVLKTFSSQPKFFDERHQATLELVAGLLAAAMAQATEFEAKKLAQEEADICPSPLKKRGSLRIFSTGSLIQLKLK